MEHHLELIFIETIVLVLGVATAVAYLFRRMRLPSVLGFILTGALIGPQGLALIRDPDMINAISQIGILFLLFIIGLELSVNHLRQLKFHAPLAGTLQLVLATVLVSGVLTLLGFPVQLAVLLGLILSLSSTAMVLKNMEELGEMDTVHGRLILGILIIQDLSTIQLMTLVPTLSSPLSEDVLMPLLTVVGKALLFMGIAVVISLKLVPALLDRLAATNSREIFTLSVVSVGLGMAYLTGYMGLSFEAGAFIAGLALSSSVYSEQAIADSRPFREVFATLFFVSVGLLMDLQFLRSHIPLVLVVTTGLVLLKFAAGFLAVRMLRFPVKTALWSGLTLFQVGEFSFILLRRVLEHSSSFPAWQHILSFWSPLLVNAIVLSMFITPLVILNIPGLLYRLSKGRKVLKEEAEERERVVPLPPLESPELEDRVLIAGYGPIAQNLVKALEMFQMPYVIVDMNLNTIKTLQCQGVHCHYGDASHPDILKAAGIETAKILAITFPDPRATEVALTHARHLNPHLHCIVRARYRANVDRLYALGADQVVYEEFEAGVNFIFNTFHLLGHPVENINQLIARFREREERSIREIPLAELPTFGRLSLMSDSKIEWLEVHPHSPMIGQTLQASEIRQVTGVNVLAIVDFCGHQEVNPSPEYELKAHDILVVLGTIEQLHKLELMVSPTAH
jgi:CPA2 family monovalent cation:H+ antiporter-2